LNQWQKVKGQINETLQKKNQNDDLHDNFWQAIVWAFSVGIKNELKWAKDPGFTNP
jgi:hypothetical protein